MTKQEATKVKVGDTVFNKHRRRLERVTRIITEHPDPHARLPMFATYWDDDAYRQHSARRRVSTYLLFQRVQTTRGEA